MANEIKLKKWDDTNNEWVQQYPEVRHTDIVASGTNNSVNYLAGDGSWKAPLYYVAGNTTGTAGTWTGTISGLTAYYDGLTIRYKMGIAGASNVYLNINNIGNAQVYRYGGARLTTHWPVNTICTLTYNSSDNRWYGTPDYNSTDDYRMRWQGDVAVGTLMHGYQIIMEGADRKFHPVTEGGSTANTNTVSTVDFLVGGTILYHNSGNNQDVDSTGIGYEVYESGQFGAMEYFNNRDSGWATARYPFYFKGTINSSGHFNLDNTSYTSWLTQTLPTSDDGFVYIQVGYMVDSYDDFRLASEHPIYIYKDGALRLYPYFPEFNGGTITNDLTISRSNVNTSLTLNSGTASSIINMNGTGTSFIEKDTGNDLYIAHNVSDKNIHFRVNDGGTQNVLMTLNGASSRVGIGTGTSNPSNKFQVVGNARVEGNFMAGDASTTNTPAKPIHIKGAGEQALRIEDTTSSNQVYDITVDKVAGFKIKDITNSSTPFSISNSGDVTISGDLTVNGTTTTLDTTVSTTDQWTVTNAGTDIATIINQTGTADILDVRDNGTSVFKVKDGGDVELGVGALYGKSVNGQYSNLYRWGGIFFTWDSDTYGTNTHHSIRSTYGDTYGDDLTINSFHHLRVNIDANNNNTDARFEIGNNTTGTGNRLFVVNENGNVGIGADTTPDEKLEVDGAGIFVSNAGQRVLYLRQSSSGAGNILQFQGASNENVWEITGRDSHFYIYNNDLSKYAMYIEDNNNRIGINGHNTPTVELDVKGQIRAFSDTSSKIWSENTGGGQASLELKNSETHLRFIADNGGFQLYDQIDGAERVAIDTSGNWTFGAGDEVTIRGDLNLAYGFPRIHLTDTDNNSDYSIINANGQLSFYDDTNSAYRMVVEADGKIGVGTGSPLTKMHIVESGTSTALTVQNASSNGTVMKLATTGDSRNLYLQTDHIYSNGNLYFGDNSYETIIRGSVVKSEGHILLNSPVNDSAPISVKSLSNGRAIHIEETGTGSESWQIGVDTAGNMNFMNSGSGTPSIRFFDNNYVAIGVSTPSEMLEVGGKVKASNGKLASVEYTNSGTTTEVDTINFDLNGSTLTITTS